MNLLKKLFCIIYIVFSVSCYSNEKNHEQAVNETTFANYDIKNFKPIHRFYGKDKKLLGMAYAKFINDDIFTSMIIKNELNDDLYFIDQSKFYNNDGLDIEVSTSSIQKFYGYKIIIKKPSYIKISYLANGGKNVSDGITIEWSYNKKRFQVLKRP